MTTTKKLEHAAGILKDNKCVIEGPTRTGFALKFDFKQVYSYLSGFV